MSEKRVEKNGLKKCPENVSGKGLKTSVCQQVALQCDLISFANKICLVQTVAP